MLVRMTEKELGQAMQLYADIENAAMIRDNLYPHAHFGDMEVYGEGRSTLATVKSLGICTIKEVAKARGRREDTTARALRQLMAEGLIEQCGKRGYQKLWRDATWQPASSRLEATQQSAANT